MTAMISVMKKCEISGECLMVVQGPESIGVVGKAFWGNAVSMVTEG